MNTIEVKNLTCTFKKRKALDDISFSVPPGSVVGVVGPNGAGKTTLIDSICGLIRPESGSVHVLGLDVAKAGAELKSQIGVLPQETALYDEVSALQNLGFSAALYNVPQPEARITELLKLVGLADRAKDAVRTFSGGMQRRVAIARALLHNPPLLILDEPTIGVDVEARNQIWAHIRSLRAAGRTVVLTTNYLDEAEALCDHMIILRAGKIVAEGSPHDLTNRTGRCLEITCAKESVPRLSQSLRGYKGVLRQEIADFGIRLYLAANVNPEDVVHDARKTAPIDGFRTRSPDLAEVFVSLGAGHEKS